MHLILSNAVSAGTRRRMLAGGCSLALMSGFASGAAAQDAGQSGGSAQADAVAADLQDAETSFLGEVVVTGSRIARDGFEAPTPVTVLSQEQIDAAAPANIADFVNQLPALSGSSSPKTSSYGIGGGTAGANFLNLRRLGTNRTLTLLDGRRVVSSALTGAVDVNMLPSALVQSVDVVTGGASAAWGSDAVAGVVNFVLDTRFEGFKAEVQGGVTDEGDNETFNADLAVGTRFAQGRGHFLATVQYASSDNAYAGDRDWFRGNKQILNPDYTPGNGEPQLITRPNVLLSQATTGGLITSGPLRGNQFELGGALAPFAFGQISGTQMIGGDGEDLAAVQELTPKLEQHNEFVRVSYDVTNSLNVFAEASYGKTVTHQTSAPYFRFGNVAVRSDNPYLSDSVVDLMSSNGIDTFNLGTTNNNLGHVIGRNERELTRIVVGASGSFGSVWTWDAYYQHGESDVVTEALNNAIVPQFNLAVDAVDNGSGTAVCRSTLIDPTNGCVPLNLFGVGAASPEAIAWINGAARGHTLLKQDVAALSVSGEPFSVPAGPVSLAAGIEYRKEQAKGDADPLSITNSYFVGNYKAFQGEYDVREAFVETVVPLLADHRFAQTLDFNGAVRVTDYSTSGMVTTWKAGLSYVPADELRFRVTASRDIRAPNLNDLFLGGQVNTQTVNDPANGNANVTFLRTLTGNPDLKPEEADTLAAGVVYSPSWLRGFTASLDVYDITIDGAIASLTNQQTIDRCFAGSAALCSQITRDTNNQITGIVISPLNIASEAISGADIELSYRASLSDFNQSWAGDIVLRALGTYIDSFTQTEGSVTQERVGELTGGGQPEWRWLASATYDLDQFSTTVKARHVSDSVFDNDFGPLDIEDNSISGRTYVDVLASYKFEIGGRQASIFGVVENVFDTAPPVFADSGSTAFLSYGATPSVHDTLGRTFRMGIRFRL